MMYMKIIFGCFISILGIAVGPHKQNYCHYLNNKIPRQKVVKHFPKHCARLVCRDDADGGIKMRLEITPKCTCTIRSRSLIDVLRMTNNVGNGRFKIKSPPSKSCQIDGRKYEAGEEVRRLDTRCIILKCFKLRNKEPELVEETIPNCECKHDYNLKDRDPTFWSYRGREGQKHWGKTFPDCNKDRQSPINLFSSNCTFVFANYTFNSRSCLRVHSSYFTKLKTWTLKNNGHFLTLTPDMNYDPSILNNHGSSDEYVFSEVQIRTQEHVEGNAAATMELHLMHYLRAYGSLETALKSEDPLAVLSLSVLVDIDGRFESNVDNLPLKKFFVKLMRSLPKVYKPHTKTFVKHDFSLSDFVQNLIGEDCYTGYVIYAGSLPYPPCSENVLNLIIRERQFLPLEYTQFVELFQHLSNIKLFENENLDFDYAFAFRDLVADNGRSTIFVEDNSPETIASQTNNSNSCLSGIVDTNTNININKIK